MVAFTSPFQEKLAVTPVKRLPINWPWPALKVPLESSSVPTPEPEELLEDELDEELELLDEELELLDEELELEEELLDDELLVEELEELDEELELLDDELPLEEVPPHAVKLTATAPAQSSRASGD
jgi:hypothetical protein